MPNKMPFKERLPRRVFNEKQYRESTFIDKIRISYIDGNYVLPPKIQGYANTLHEMFTILCSHTRQITAVREIKKRYTQYNNQTINKMIGEVQYLYSNITERNALWEAIMHREQTLRHMEICEKDKDFENVARFSKILIDIDKRIDLLSPIIEDKHTAQLPKIMLSADPSLLAAQKNITEDAEYEEE